MEMEVVVKMAGVGTSTGGTSGITDPSDPSNYVSSNSGGLDSAPVAPGSPGAYQEIVVNLFAILIYVLVIKFWLTTRKGDTVE